MNDVAYWLLVTCINGAFKYCSESICFTIAIDLFVTYYAGYMSKNTHSKNVSKSI